ncbi:hypothetical protein CEXT_573091 [Caerostris extrusa]|uniref:Uncharacterized protein n=1 Tax=Caerostris extrusa TaxID=172846 RepID=A0AAV4WQN9_CAEEX|nr:hypothetical protein CEXT_573091 [Caerostris extrusa]
MEHHHHPFCPPTHQKRHFCSFFFLAMMDADIYGIVSMLNGIKDRRTKALLLPLGWGREEDSDWNKRTSDDLIELNGKTRFSRSYARDRR